MKGFQQKKLRLLFFAKITSYFMENNRLIYIYGGNIMKKISELINSPITWKQSIVAAIIGMMLSLIVIAAEFVSWNKMTSKSFKKAKHK